MDCVIQIVGKSLHCLQLDRNLWRIYLIKKDAHNLRQKTCFRMELLFGMPQFLSLIHTLTRLETTMLMKKTMKILICDLRLFIDDLAAYELLDYRGVKSKRSKKTVFVQIIYQKAKRLYGGQCALFG